MTFKKQGKVDLVGKPVEVKKAKEEKRKEAEKKKSGK